MHSEDVVAALLAAKFLLTLNRDSETPGKLFSAVSSLDTQRTDEFPRRQHRLFSALSPDSLKNLIQESAPKMFRKNQIICEEGDIAESCFFPVCGTIMVEGSNVPQPIPIPPGEIIGEFALWIPNIRRIARLRAAGDALLLEVRHESFQAIARRYPPLAEAVYAIIRHRILENVVRSPGFFPQVSEPKRQELMQMPSECQKYAAGSSLDLGSRTYVLFNGKVRITPPNGPSLEIEARGHFGHETVIGIVTEFGAADGDKAEILEDCVAVSFPHDVVGRLQRESPAIEDTWGSILGRRMVEIQRQKRRALSETA